jgi:hypothetical protein
VILANALNAWSARPELATFHNDFIELTESVLNARLHERHLETFTTYGISLGAGAVTLSNLVIDVLGMRIGDADVTWRPRHEVIEARTLGGSETLACIVGRTIELSTLAATQAEVREKRRITTLIGGGTNWVFTNFPNVYLFGCLVELFDHLRDETQTAHYKTRFEEALALVNSTMTNRSLQQFARVRSVR